MIFAVFSTTKADLLKAAIVAAYPDDSSLEIREGQWLLFDNGISPRGVAEKLGVVGTEPSAVGAALIVGVNGYSGRQPSNVWDWLNAKLEAK